MALETVAIHGDYRDIYTAYQTQQLGRYTGKNKRATINVP